MSQQINQDHPGHSDAQYGDLERELGLLRRQLALKERELQRLLVVVAEQATEVDQLQAQQAAQMLELANKSLEIQRQTENVQLADASAALFENTIRYAQEMFSRLPFDFGSNNFFESCDQIEQEVATLTKELGMLEAAASV